MQKLLLVFFLLYTPVLFAQKGFLYVKKKGFKKLRSFEEGSAIRFETSDEQVVYGTMTLVKKDSILVNNNWYGITNIKKIFLQRKKNRPPHLDIFLWTTAGVALSTAGMTLAGWTNFGRALAYSAGVGYGNYLITYFPNLKRKKYKIGKKFTLQTFDLHF